MQWFAAVVDLPLDVGGRPLHSGPMFVPVAFALAILGGALAAFVACIAGNRLPDLAHPVFDLPDFEFATRHRFFLCLRAGDDDGFDAAAAAAWLDARRPLRREALWC